MRRRRRRFPFTADQRGLAQIDEATLVYEWFRSTGTPISLDDAKRLAFLDFRVRTRHVSEFPSFVEPRQPFISHDPRRSFS